VTGGISSQRISSAKRNATSSSGPDARRDDAQHALAEALVFEPLGRDEQQVDQVVRSRSAVASNSHADEPDATMIAGKGEPSSRCRT